MLFLYESINYCFHDFFLLNSSIHKYFTRQSNRDDVFRNHRNSLQYGLKSIRYIGQKNRNTEILCH